MLSIIICSVSEELLSDLKANIASTVGLEYELLIWDNRQENLGLCEVYNRMASAAKYPYLCFLHEDIVFQTKSWGKNIEQLFSKNRKVGLIGVAGGKYKSKCLSGWFSGIPGMDYFHISHINGQHVQIVSNAKSWNHSESKVVCIDGVFMCAKKNVWEESQFNEKLFKGFHFYDIDFSLRISQAYDVIVTQEIEISHLTLGGDFGDRWVKEAFLFHSAYAKILPYSLAKIDLASSEFVVAKTWLDRLKSEQISLANKFKWVKVQHLHKQKKLWLQIMKFFFYKPLGLVWMHAIVKKIKTNK